MRPCQHPLSAYRSVLACALAGLLVTACSGGSEPHAPAASGQAQPAQAAQPAPAARPAVQHVKACSLLTKAEVEAATGRAVLDPIEEEMAELSVCSFGDPDGPKVGGRSLSKVVVLSVFSGGNGYYAGPVAQAGAIYDTAVKGAGEVEAVSGLGDKAHWAGRTLRVLRRAYMVEIETDAGKDDRKIARQLVETVLGRLP